MGQHYITKYTYFDANACPGDVRVIKQKPAVVGDVRIQCGRRDWKFPC